MMQPFPLRHARPELHHVPLLHHHRVIGMRQRMPCAVSVEIGVDLEFAHRAQGVGAAEGGEDLFAAAAWIEPGDLLAGGMAACQCGCQRGRSHDAFHDSP